METGKYAARLMVLVLLIISVGCKGGRDELPAGHQVDGKVSPDGLSRAFVWVPGLAGLGATVSQPYQVWLESSNRKGYRALVLEADKTDGVRLKWRGANELEICYGPSQISSFRNFFVFAEQSVPVLYKVEIFLRRVNQLNDC